MDILNVSVCRICEKAAMGSLSAMMSVDLNI